MTDSIDDDYMLDVGLNPCCAGYYSLTACLVQLLLVFFAVLILVVLDTTL